MTVLCNEPHQASAHGPRRRILKLASPPTRSGPTPYHIYDARIKPQHLPSLVERILQ